MQDGDMSASLREFLGLSKVESLDRVRLNVVLDRSSNPSGLPTLFFALSVESAKPKVRTPDTGTPGVSRQQRTLHCDSDLSYSFSHTKTP